QLAPEGTTHRHAFADLADVREPRAGCEDVGREIRLEAAGDRPSWRGTRRHGALPGSLMHASMHANRGGRQALPVGFGGCPRSPTSFPARARNRWAWAGNS